MADSEWNKQARMAYKNSRLRPEWSIVFTKFRPQLNVHILIYTDLFIRKGSLDAIIIDQIDSGTAAVSASKNKQ